VLLTLCRGGVLKQVVDQYQAGLKQCSVSVCLQSLGGGASAGGPRRNKLELLSAVTVRQQKHRQRRTHPAAAGRQCSAGGSAALRPIQHMQWPLWLQPGCGPCIEFRLSARALHRAVQLVRTSPSVTGQQFS
jgi:hypothetical protein